MSRTIELSDDVIQTLVRIQRQLMSDWSESWWAAGWMVDTEKRAWEGAAFNDREMSAYDADVVAIHELSKITGVWCLMESTVPLDEWERLHGPALTKMADLVPTPEQEQALQRANEAQRQHLEHIRSLRGARELGR